MFIISSLKQIKAQRSAAIDAAVKARPDDTLLKRFGPFPFQVLIDQAAQRLQQGGESVSKGIYAKILLVMEEVDRIAKRGVNKAQNYDYLMAEDVLHEVRQEFIKQKLVVIPACVSQEVVEGQSKSGGTQYLTKAHLQYTICDAESGETVTVPWQGQGQDSGDKGLYKAFTGGGKYWLKNLLMIPTGDDPENDGAQPKPHAQKPHGQSQPHTQQAPAGKTISVPQQNRLYAVAAQNGWSADQVSALLKEEKGYTSAEQIKMGVEYDNIVAFFQNTKPGEV